MIQRSMKKPVFYWIVCLAIILFLPLIGYSDEIEDAVEDAVDILDEEGLASYKTATMHIEVKNYDSNKADRDAIIIRGSLYSALKSKYPRANILQVEDSLGGISMVDDILISGTYRLMGEDTVLSLQAKNQENNSLIAKADLKYESQTVVDENLVVVLDIQSEYLENRSKRLIKSYSRILRSALLDTGQFNLVSSDVIDNANAEEIQKRYECTREACGTIIAQQLNASQAINVTYEQIDEDFFYLNGALKDINSGRTLAAASIEHDGNLKTLKSKINDVACKLAKTCGQPQVVKQAKLEIKPEPILEPEPVNNMPIEPQPLPEPQIEEDDGVSWWVWALGGVALVALAVSAGDSGSDSEDNNTDGSGSSSSNTGVGFTW